MEEGKRGKLKIFFSYAESIGKTDAMLKAAIKAKDQGMNVVAGYIAPHFSYSAQQLLEKLPAVPLARTSAGAAFDVEAALELKPDLIVVDELAFTNPPGSRHRKRYQDVDELIQSGISVYTTVNVGNIESLHDTVSSITGVTTWERIPDEVFDQADQVELLDIEPQELIEKLQVSDTADSRFTVEQMTALREIALRRCADRVRRISDRLEGNSSFHTDEHILVCLSSAPSNAKIIRTAARMAKAFNSQFTALFVETKDRAVQSAENRKRLEDNTRLAEQLGAKVETVFGMDVPYQIAEFARLSGVTRIVLGRSSATRRRFFGKTTLTEQLLNYAPEIDIHIIPDRVAGGAFTPARARRFNAGGVISNVLKSLAVIVAATLLCFLFDSLGFTAANIIMVYILAVLVISIVTSHTIYSLISSIASVFLFNFLFIAPRFSMRAYETGYPVTFVTMFLTAYITGTFAIRYKEQSKQSAMIAYRQKILFDTNQMLSKVSTREDIIDTASNQIVKLLGREVVVFAAEDGRLSSPLFYGEGTLEREYDYESERPAVEWVYVNNHVAGATTDTLSDKRCIYLAIRVNEKVYGVIGADVKNRPLDPSEHDILLSILGEFALALGNEQNAREKEAAAVFAESEQLRANLLRTISHDLRTPLTTLSGNASNLLSNGDSYDDQTRKLIYTDIYNDAVWLIDLVENLLYSTRIEEGRMVLDQSPQLISEIVDAAVSHIRRKVSGHDLSISYEDDLMLVRADATLLVQVVTNLLDNAIKYTEKGSPITIQTRRNGSMALVMIADTGTGIPDSEKEKVFERFYSGTNKIADNRRRLGLGLYLCKAIVEAHGGQISVEDNKPHGCVFSFTVPLAEEGKNE